MCLNFALTVVRSDKRALHLVVICNPFGVWPFSTQDIMKLRCDCILVRLEAAFLYLCRKASRSLSSIGRSSSRSLSLSSSSRVLCLRSPVAAGWWCELVVCFVSMSGYSRSGSSSREVAGGAESEFLGLTP